MNEPNQIYSSLHVYRSTNSFNLLQNIGRLVRRLIELLEFTEPEMNNKFSRSEAIRRLIDGTRNNRH